MTSAKDSHELGGRLTTFHSFHDAVDAVLGELDDRGLLNGVDEDLHQEIGNAVVNRVTSALSHPAEAEWAVAVKADSDG